jgi:hypothetical protein
MPHYNITFYEDMGHLMISPMNLPKHIYDYAYAQSQRYLSCAIDKDKLGCLFYYLPSQFKKNWSYKYGDDTVNIDWNVGRFNPEIMIALGK